MFGKKPPIEIAVGIPKKAPESAPDMDGPSDDDMHAHKMEAAQTLIDAIKAGDAAAVSEALSTHAGLCEHESDAPADDNEEEPS
jgi:DNA-binding GntR family transcriptional regulator